MVKKEEKYYCLEDDTHFQIGKSNQSGYFTLRIPKEIFKKIKEGNVARIDQGKIKLDNIKYLKDYHERRVAMKLE